MALHFRFSRLHRVSILAALLLASGCSPFSIDAITPAEIPAGEDTEVAIAGEGFSEATAFALEAEGLSVTLAPRTLADTEVTVVVPSAVPAGVYSVVAEEEGRIARLDDALTVVEGTARFVFIDVSQGDATLIITPDGDRILVDGGKRDASTAVAAAITDFARGGLDAVIVSHFDADHLGGVVEILQGPDGRPGSNDDVLLPTAWAPEDQNTCASVVCQDMRRLQTRFETPTVGQTLAFGDFVLEVVAVGGDIGAGPVAGADDENERSLAVLAHFGGRKVLVAGDLTGGGLNTVNLEGPLAEQIGPVDVVRTAHHGSATSSPAAAVEAYQASVAIFSMGEDNAFCHPDATVFSRWNQSGAALYGTTAGIVFDADTCDGATPVPDRGRFDVGDIVMDVDASGALIVDGDVLAP